MQTCENSNGKNYVKESKNEGIAPSLLAVTFDLALPLPGLKKFRHCEPFGYSLKSSRMRLIWPRLTGISVCFLSLIFSM